MEETIINKITDVKYTGDMSPTARPFWDTINATSPRVIIPTPIFRESIALNLQILAISPQPTIFVSNATITNPIENNKISIFKLSMLVFKPILAKNTGPNNI